MLLLYVVITLVPSLREFFELTLLRAIDYLCIGLAVAVWAVALRLVWRRRLFEWWLGIEDRGSARIGGDAI
jgi:hypothetical protein